MSFANPTYLWALLGLLVPIAIHLWSNKAGKTIKVGSIQLFKESDSSKSRSIKLNEHLLLSLRLLALLLLVLTMAKPLILKNIKNTSITYIIEPALLLNDDIRTMADTLKTDDEVRLLQKDFPEISTLDLSKESFAIPNYWQLAQQMETLKTDSVVVFTSASYSGIKGKRPTLKKPSEWIVFPLETNQTNQPIAAYEKDNKIEITSVYSSSENLRYKTETIGQNSDRLTYNTSKDSITLDSYKNIVLNSDSNYEIYIFHDEALNNQLYYLESSINAISKYIDRPISITKEQSVNTSDTNDYHLVIWLSETEAPKTTTKMLTYQLDDLAAKTITTGSVNNLYYLTRPLTATTMINERFSEQLLQLFDYRVIDQDELSSIDKRLISMSELSPNVISRNKEKLNASILDLSVWFWLALATILCVERIIASRRKQ